MKYRSVGLRPALPQRTLDYLATGAQPGSRNAELFAAAVQFRDAGISHDEAEPQLIERAVADGLSEVEAHATMESAYSHAPRSPVQPGAGTTNPRGAKTTGKPQVEPPVPGPLPLPEPVPGGFLKLLATCFQPDEHVAIAPAGEDVEGNIVPKRGVTLTAAEWRKRVEAKGGIDKCFTTKLGLFCRINAVCPGGSRNSDVTSYRHVLVEFDRDAKGEPIPKEIQFGMLAGSGMPVSVVIDSGNKSLHGWIAVDAPNAEEYRRRVEVIFDWFANCGCAPDPQNRNPARLSRCPDGRRTVGGEVRQQQLLAVNLGAKSWSEWETNQEQNELGDPMRISQLAAYDTQHDPNNMLGRRWLCRGSSLVIVGQSGIGKSSLCMQLMILWALALPAFGIEPVRPLRSLIIQAENDPGDLAEMYQGVQQGMGLTPDQERLLEDRIFIYRDTTHTGPEFVRIAAALIDRHHPDLVWCDPLLNYIGDEISEQKVISDFCCKNLNAVSVKTGVIWCLLHHTGKPSKDPKATTHWTASDLAYSGLGSSALVNWSRETAVLVRIKTPEGQPPTFQLSMTKRRTRAGLKTSQGNSTDTIFLRHSDHGGICWTQCEPPAREENKERYRPKGRPSAFNEAAFRAVIEEHGGDLTRENESAVAAKMKVKVRTIWNWHKKLNAKE